MRTEVVYQRWLECDVPTECGGDRAAPIWTWPVPLLDGRAIVTLLYRPLGGPNPGPRTLVIELSPEGEAVPWKPAEGYPAPVIFYGNHADDLVGMDLVRKGKVYACRPDGRHLWTLEVSLKMDNLIAPRLFRAVDDRMVWQAADGRCYQGCVRNGVVGDIASLPAAPDLESGEVHFPHTHLTGDGTLWVFDFDPMPRVTRVRVASS